MESNGKRVEISGAGPAGLAAAIAVARAGRRPVVFERRPDVGGRFHGDFQGIENWSTEGDAPEAPSAVNRSTGSGLRFVTTTSWPPPIRRRAMLAPMRPNPIIPHCMSSPPLWIVARSPAGTPELVRMLALDGARDLLRGVIPAPSVSGE